MLGRVPCWLAILVEPGSLCRSRNRFSFFTECKFDGELADVFNLQDQVTSSVVAAIEPSLRRAEIDRAGRKPTDRQDAYDCYLRATSFYALNGVSSGFAVGNRVTPVPLHRSVRAGFPHTAPTLGV
jgi:hypothetical protein